MKRTMVGTTGLLWMFAISMLCMERSSSFGVPPTFQKCAAIVSNNAPDATDAPSSAIIESSRREWTKRAFSAVVTGVGITVANASIEPAMAAEKGDTVWKTGKSPIVPGEKPRDKSDVKGTRKDPAFLRSLSDCKSKCESTPGPEGLAKSKEECLAECQDICCTTYEQCTFAIVPR